MVNGYFQIENIHYKITRICLQATLQLPSLWKERSIDCALIARVNKSINHQIPLSVSPTMARISPAIKEKKQIFATFCNKF